MANLRKVSLALNPDHVDQLDYVSKRLGMSRSALVSNLLSGALPDLVSITASLPISSEPADVLRFRGESAKLIEARMQELQGVVDGLSE